MSDKTMPARPSKTPKYEFGERSLRCLQGVHPHLIALAHKALELSAVDFGVHCGVRTMEQQKQLVAQRRSMTLESRHIPMLVRSGGNGKGHAIDCHVYLPGRPDDAFDWPQLALIDDAFLAASKLLLVPYNWGGNWSRFPDGPHFELPSDQYAKDAPITPLPGEAPKKKTRRGCRAKNSIS